jgi:prepilin-type N-terminal cleavage/methylation domain-containing protein
MRSIKAFTLVELLITIIIVGIILSITVPKIFKQIKKSRTREAITNINKIAELEIEYYKKIQKFLNAPIMPEKIPGKKKVKASFNKTNWKELGFNPKEEIYYQYEIKAIGEGKYSKCAIFAFGDLDSDEEKSSFEMNLWIEPETGEIKKSEIIKFQEFE